MMLRVSVLFSILVLSCSLFQINSASSQRSTTKIGFYGLIIETICRDTGTGSVRAKCKSCLAPLISKQSLSKKEVPLSKITKLKSCMEHIPEEFKEFRCQLETNSSYHFRDFVDKACFDKLQSSSPFIDLEKADLSKIKSNPGYYGLSELTGLTLVGIIKHSKLNNERQSSSAAPRTQDFCTSFQESGFLTALSQAHGKSWEPNFEKRTTLFFDAVNEFVCKTHAGCYECLKTYLNDDTVSEKELSSKTFNGIIKCKETLPNDFKNFNITLQKSAFQGKIPQSCINDLKLKEKSFKYGVNVDKTDLRKNTYFLQEALKMGITTVFYYFTKIEEQISDDMTSGLCETVVRRYVKSFLYAMPSLHKDGQVMQDHSEYPYRKVIKKACGVSKKCEACYKKITSLIDIKKPKEVSKDDMQVLKHCSGYQSEEFKSFVEDFEDTSFQTCMKNDASYKALIKDYPIDQEVDIKSSPALPNFPNFKKYLEFLFDGVCYYYKDQSKKGVKLAKELHKMDLPGAYLFAIPATNEYDTRGCPREAQ